MTDSGIGQLPAAGQTGRLHLSSRHRKKLEALLREHLPEIEVWAYGSRVNDHSHDGSDLDLVLRAPGLQEIPIGPLTDFTEALHNSTLPFLVEARDWARLPARFHREIERGYVVVQKKNGRTAADGWPEVTLGDRLVMNESTYSPKESWPLINYLDTGNITDNRVSEIQCLIPSTDKVPSRARRKVRDGDIVYSTVRPNQRHFGLLREIPINCLVSTGFVVIRGKKHIADTEFIFWFLTQNHIVEHLQTIAEHSTSAYPSIKPSDIKQLKLRLPPLDEQRAIAHILGTLDDKIELNRRMNETLEAMARALFKSWFVDFTPVRAKMEGRWRPGESLPGLPAHLYDLFPDRLVGSELGEVPEGWEVKALGTFGEIITGKTPSTKRPEYYGEDIPFLRIPDMHGNMYAIKTEVMLSTQGAESQSKKTLPPGSVSVSCIATPGLVVLNHRDTQTNQQINSIIPYDRSVSRYLYWACCHLSSDIAIGGLGGSVFGNMNKSTFSVLPTIHPEPTIVRAFDALVSPIHTAILANEKQIHTLAEQRDALLPGLVSGELSSGCHNAYN